MSQATSNQSKEAEIVTPELSPKELLKGRLHEIREDMKKQPQEQPEEKASFNPCFMCKFNTDNVKLRTDEVCTHIIEMTETGFSCDEFKAEDETPNNVLADYLMSYYYFKTMRDSKEIYVYQDGVYQPNGEIIIAKEIENVFEAKVKLSCINEVLGHIKRRTFTVRDEFDKDSNLLVVENGILNLKTKELTEHTHHYLSIIKLPVTYNPEAKCPRILQFFGEVVDIKDVSKLIEVVGYCLLRTFQIARIVVLVGLGANGKSVYTLLITNLLGKENISSVTLQKIAEGGFRTAELYGKLANICGDIPSKPLKETGTLKLLTGQDPITAEKKFHNPFQFYNFAKPIFSANQIPPTSDDTLAFYRRIVIIQFPNQFLRDNPKTDINLLEKLTTEEELSGLLNLALEGLKRLREQGGFTNEKSVEERKNEYIKESNPIHYFALKHVVKDLKAPFISNAELYNYYTKLCEELEQIPKANNYFGREIKRYLPYTYQSTVTINKVKTKGWRGIKVVCISPTLNNEGNGSNDSNDISNLRNYSEVNKEIIENAVSTVPSVTEAQTFRGYVKQEYSVGEEIASRELGISVCDLIMMAKRESNIDYVKGVFNWKPTKEVIIKRPSLSIHSKDNGNLSNLMQSPNLSRVIQSHPENCGVIPSKSINQSYIARILSKEQSRERVRI